MVPAPARFDTVLDRIRAFAAARGWRPARLAREARLSDTATRGMERDDWLPSGSTIRALESLIAPGWSPGDPLPEEAAHDGGLTSSEAASVAPGEVA